MNSQNLLSSILELIANYCKLIGINRYQASHIRIETFKEIAFSNYGNELTTKIIKDEFSKNQALRKIYELIYKPDIFINGNELLFDKSINFRPTYVGESITEGNIIKLEDFKNENQIILDNKIILIENADPGYDYIFGYK